MFIRFKQQQSVKGQRIKARAARTSTNVLWIGNCIAQQRANDVTRERRADVVAAILKVISKIRLDLSMRIYLKKNPAEFHRDSI